MRCRLCFLMVVGLLLQVSGWAQMPTAKATIVGNAKEYRGLKLQFYTPADHLTKEKLVLASFEPNPNDGGFEVEVNVAETQCVQIDLGVYTGKVYVEPGKRYELVLPPRTNLGKAEIYNPFFKPEDVFLGVVNRDAKDLNTVIANLEDSIGEYIGRGMHVLVRTADRKLTEKIIARIEKAFVAYKDPYFVAYAYYRFQQIRYSIYARSDHAMLKSSFVDKPILLNVPPYVNLFQDVARDGLTRSSNTEKWSAHNIIDKELGLEVLRDSMGRFDFVGKGDFRDLYLLQGLFDAAYNRDFPKEKVVNLLRELATKAKTENLREAAGRVATKTAYLMVGQLAPDLELRNVDGEIVHLSDFNGKFLYLNFGALWSAPFRKELKLLKKLNDQGVKDLQILTVSFDEDFEETIAYKQKEGYNWPFLHFDFKEEVAKTYQIKVYPTYYLIGPNGVLLQSPAIGISENFGNFFLEIYNKWRREKFKENNALKKEKK